MNTEQAQTLLSKLETLSLNKAKGADTGKLVRFKRELKWALGNISEEERQDDLDKLELNFISEESLDNLVQNDEDRSALASYLLIIPQE